MGHDGKSNGLCVSQFYVFKLKNYACIYRSGCQRFWTKYVRIPPDMFGVSVFWFNIIILLLLDWSQQKDRSKFAVLSHRTVTDVTFCAGLAAWLSTRDVSSVLNVNFTLMKNSAWWAQTTFNRSSSGRPRLISPSVWLSETGHQYGWHKGSFPHKYHTLHWSN